MSDQEETVLAEETKTNNELTEHELESVNGQSRIEACAAKAYNKQVMEL